MTVFLLISLVVAIALAAFLKWAAAKTRAAALYAEQQIPAIGRMVSLPHTQVHVVERGQARPGVPALLMVHGLAGQLHHFHYGLMAPFEGETRVVAVDRPGSGYSTREAGHAITLQDQADVLAALIDELGLGQPVVVGHSLGGALALTLALRHPGKVRALALIAPATHTPDKVPAAFRGIDIELAWLQRWVANTVAVPFAAMQRDRIMGMIFGPEAVPAGYDVRGGGLLSLRPAHIVAAAEDLQALPKHLPAIEAMYAQFNSREPALPIHILYGRGDRILDPAFHGEAFVAKVPRAKLTLVDGGHMLPLTQPARCVEFIRGLMAA